MSRLVQLLLLREIGMYMDELCCELWPHFGPFALVPADEVEFHEVLEGYRTITRFAFVTLNLSGRLG